MVVLILWRLKYLNNKNMVIILLKFYLDYKADLWSLGVILYYMIFHSFPFLDRVRLLENIEK